jgi:hypothetical protein
MTIRSFWIIILRLIGLWFVIQSLTIIYQLFGSIFLFSNEADISSVLIFAFTLALTLTLYLLIMYLCFYKTTLIIDKLKLDSGFTDKKIELNNNQKSIVIIAVIIIGGLVFIFSFPAFIKDLISYLQVNVQYGQRIRDLSSFQYFYLLKTLIGILLMTNSRLIASLIVRQTNTTNKSDTE